MLNWVGSSIDRTLVSKTRNGGAVPPRPVKYTEKPENFVEEVAIKLANKLGVHYLKMGPGMSMPKVKFQCRFSTEVIGDYISREFLVQQGMGVVLYFINETNEDNDLSMFRLITSITYLKGLESPIHVVAII